MSHLCWKSLLLGVILAVTTFDSGLATTGGPDTFGHRWSDEDAFSWFDASTGTDTGISADDGWYGPYSIGFNFLWYGQTFTEFTVTPNGAVRFVAGSATSIITCATYGLSTHPNGFIAFGGDRAVFSTESGWVKYLVSGTEPDRTLIIEFNRMRRNYGSQTELLDLEIVLYENGGDGEKAVLATRNLTSITNFTSFIGIESNDGSDYLVYLDGCPGAGNVFSEGLAVTFSFGRDPICVELENPVPERHGSITSVVAHLVGVYNCGSENHEFLLSATDNIWPVQITDLNDIPITSIFVASEATAYCKVKVTTPARAGTDTVSIEVASSSRATADEILLTTKALHFFQSFDTDPINAGWTFSSAGWEWGAATPSACSLGSDPAFDTSSSENNYILGYEIGGCYSPNMASPDYAVSPSYNFSGLSGIKLVYERWLGVESVTFDQAGVQISVNGGVWTTVWQNPTGTINDASWGSSEHDISQYADDQTDVRIRYSLGPTDSSVVFFGWNLDDLGFIGVPPGYLQGVVTGKNGPLSGATVRVQETGKTVYTTLGAYSLTLAPGTYTIVVTALGYNPSTISGVVITEATTTTLDVALTYPLLSVAPTSFEKVLPFGATTTDILTLTNNGTGDLDFAITLEYEDAKGTPNFIKDIVLKNISGLPAPYSLSDPPDVKLHGRGSPRASDVTTRPPERLTAETSARLHQARDQAADGDRWIYDLLFSYILDPETSSTLNLGADFDGTHFYITSSNQDIGNTITVLDIDGNYVDQFPQGTTSYYGMRDLAYDGTYLYGGDENGFYQIDPVSQTVTTLFTSSFFPGGLSTIRGLAYNQDNDHFYASNWNDPVVEFSRDLSTVVLHYPGLNSCFGMAYDNASGAPSFWVFEQAGNPTSRLRKFDALTFAYTGTTYTVPLLDDLISQLAGGLFFGIYSGRPFIGGLVQGTPDDILFGLSLGSWFNLDSFSGTIPPDPPTNSYEIEVLFDAGAVSTPGDYRGMIVISHNATAGKGVTRVPVTLHVTADYWVYVIPPSQQQFGPLGGTADHTFRVFNLGQADDTYTLTITDNTWGMTIASHPTGVVTVPAGDYVDVIVRVYLPSLTVQPGDYDEAVFTATSQTSPAVMDSSDLLTTIYQTIPWVEPFELDDGNLLMEDLSGGVSFTSWEWGSPSLVGPPAAHGGSKCWGTDLDATYQNYTYATLTSPPLYWSRTNPVAHLSFWHWFSIEEGYDAGWLEINNGSGWRYLDPIGGYPDPEYDYFTGESGDWIESEYDLTDYNEQVVLVRWVFSSDSTATSSGWYLDDLTIAFVYDVFINPVSAMAWDFPTYTTTLPFTVLNATGIDNSVTMDISGPLLTWAPSYPGTASLLAGDNYPLGVTVHVPYSTPFLGHRTGVLTVTADIGSYSDTAEILVGAGAPTWAQPIDMPHSGRGWTDFIAASGKIYCPSGSESPLSPTPGAMWIYDPSNNQWSYGAVIPVKVSNYSAVMIDGVVYVPCGYDLVTNTPYNDVQVYNLTENTWAVKGHQYPGDGYIGQAAAAADGLVYVFGGAYADMADLIPVADVYSYNPQTGVWTRLASMPQEAMWARAASDDSGNIYVAGGTSLSGDLDTLNKYSIATDTWSSVTTLPTAAFAGRLEYYQDYLFYIGGVDSRMRTEVDVYGPLSGSPEWFRIPDLNTPKYQQGSALLVDQQGAVWLYTGGGYNYQTGLLLSSFERYLLQPEPPASIPTTSFAGIVVLLTLMSGMFVLQKRR